MNPRRIVVDTNVILSATFWAGPPRQLIAAVKSGQVIMLTTPDVVGEYERVLNYEKFTPHLQRAGHTISGLVTDYTRMTVLVSAGVVPEDAVADRKDPIILAAAIGGNADAIVSGDDHLLRLKAYTRIDILRVVDFLALIQEN